MVQLLAIGFCLVLLGEARGQDQAPELKVLNRWVGTWKTEVVSKPAEWNPTETKTVGTITCKWSLGGKFVEETGSSLGQGTEHRVLWGYDPQRQAYRYWFFDSSGSHGSTLEGQGTWDAKTNTLNSKAEVGPGLTGTATHHFLDPDTYEWTTVVKDGAGKIYLDIKGKHTRVK